MKRRNDFWELFVSDLEESLTMVLSLFLGPVDQDRSFEHLRGRNTQETTDNIVEYRQEMLMQAAYDARNHEELKDTPPGYAVDIRI